MPSFHRRERAKKRFNAAVRAEAPIRYRLGVGRRRNRKLLIWAILRPALRFSLEDEDALESATTPA